MSDNIFDRIIFFITEQGFGYTLPFPFLFKRKNMVRETELENDLGITGDDSDDFLIAFGKEFNVDVSGFPIGDYFKSEGDKILPEFFRRVTGTKPAEKKALTIGDLEKAVVAGRLDEEIINS